MAVFLRACNTGLNHGAKRAQHKDSPDYAIQGRYVDAKVDAKVEACQAPYNTAQSARQSLNPLVTESADRLIRTRPPVPCVLCCIVCIRVGGPSVWLACSLSRSGHTCTCITLSSLHHVTTLGREMRLGRLRRRAFSRL